MLLKVGLFLSGKKSEKSGQDDQDMTHVEPPV